MRFLLSVLLFLPMLSWALVFPIPKSSPAIVGHWQIIHVQPGDNLSQLARAYHVSINEIMQANSDIPSAHMIKIGQKLLIPTCYELPNLPRKGIVVNIDDQTLYYYPKNKDEVYVFPVTVGTPENPTPVGIFKVIKKSMNPPWFPPKSVRATFAKRGIELPAKVPPGKTNPLGKYVLYLNTPQYWIHTTPSVEALGGEQSYGCVRMYEDDVRVLYDNVNVNTRVHIIEQPINHLALAKYCMPQSVN
tara:strand:- start:243248 stop:243985 length:738 start_codon:yes stop_codon:yes gene_type:complete